MKHFYLKEVVTNRMGCVINQYRYTYLDSLTVSDTSEEDTEVATDINHHFMYSA